MSKTCVPGRKEELSLQDKTIPEKDLIVAVFEMIQDQQKVTRRTGQLLENLMIDLSKVRGASEQVAILAARIEEVERARKACEAGSKECKNNFCRMLDEQESKRELNKDKITGLELQHQKDIEAIRRELQTELLAEIVKLRLSMQLLTTSLADYKEKMAWKAGGIGGTVALIVSLLMGLLAWFVQLLMRKGSP